MLDIDNIDDVNFVLQKNIKPALCQKLKEIFELYFNRRKFYMFPIVIILIALIGVTALAQSGLVAFIYPI